ncbi:unnamed protein product [Owenia fusiformis]|uniref:Polysaccharide biosynthesis domain-containing protein n=1 Tax=Owenia fusiformis TaxID=6347 RepID=A0A8J1XFY4_OWEFU|nr:unnamed protein product [Owenia fusiformis]
MVRNNLIGPFRSRGKRNKKLKMAALGNLGSGSTAAVKDMFEAPDSKIGNAPMMEVQWALKSYSHAETYFNLITSVDPKLLKLTKKDNEIYAHFREDFKDVVINKIDEDSLKSPDSKKKWRKFCEEYRGEVEDYNFGTLLRIDSTEDISDKNTCIVPRVQFLAIEIARNREGYNDSLRQKYKNTNKNKTKDSNGISDSDITIADSENTIKQALENGFKL